MTRTEIVCDNATALERILERCPKHIVAAIPLGLGKPNRLLNAIYDVVRRDPSRSLKLFTALSLARPQPKPCLLYTSPSPRDRTRSRMPSSA